MLRYGPLTTCIFLYLTLLDVKCHVQKMMLRYDMLTPCIMYVPLSYVTRCQVSCARDDAMLRHVNSKLFLRSLMLWIIYGWLLFFDLITERTS
jgi:hypothetical protein